MATYEDQVKLVRDVFEHVQSGGHVELRDRKKEMLVGWGGVASDKTWHLMVVFVRSRRAGALIATPDGRRQIAHNFNHGHPLDRELQEDCPMCVVEDVMGR